jgi:hypothetical protein
LLDAELALFDFANTQARPGMTAAELESMKIVVEGNGFPGVIFHYAAALALNGRQGEAAKALDQLCHMSQPKPCAEAREAWEALRESRPQIKLGDPRVSF